MIAYDHRGVGESSRVEAPFTTADLAEDAAGLLDALEVESAHVLGISMGGMVAQELVLAHPQRVRTLALGCTYCGGEGSTLASPPVAQRLFEAMSSGEREDVLRTAWEICISPRSARRRRALRDLPRAGERTAGRARGDCGADAGDRRPRHLRATLRSRVPTLIVHGTADELIPVQNAHVIAGHMPDARLELFDDIGHLFFWELPQRSAELVVRARVGQRVAIPHRAMTARELSVLTDDGVTLSGEETDPVGPDPSSPGAVRERVGFPSSCCTGSPPPGGMS